MYKYEYTISDKDIALHVLSDQIYDSLGFYPIKSSFNDADDWLEIIFNQELSSGQTQQLLSLVTGYTENDLIDYNNSYENNRVFDIYYPDSQNSFIGYGEPNACSIQKIITISGNSYNSFWAEGNRLYNKNWNDKEIYTYSAIT